LPEPVLGLLELVEKIAEARTACPTRLQAVEVAPALLELVEER
jgi:hypothetical protein